MFDPEQKRVRVVRSGGSNRGMGGLWKGKEGEGRRGRRNIGQGAGEEGMGNPHCLTRDVNHHPPLEPETIAEA